ncbi:MAG: hypothetical protein K5945_10165 [Bacteroidaceae bacterium]|nr:hypothetical protein [Bacteroidaceae bacterium]
MKHYLTLLLAALMCVGFTAEVWADTNYDESKVPNYELPDVLTCQDGTKVTSVELWEQKRRPELLDIFQSQEYGYTPQGNVEVSYEVVAEKPDAIDGLATAQQVMFTFRGQGKEVKALALVYIPNNRQGSVPVFIGYNFQGNHNTTTDDWVRYSPYFERLSNRQDPILNRGAQVSRWPVKNIVGRGYAVVTMCYHDIYPDNTSGAAESIIPLLPQTEVGASRWQALGAWAWGSSRIADWVVQQSWANKDQLSVIGHSRQGKAAIWAGVQDTRFRVVISNDSGCGGAALSKREFGETISSITSNFPHWFCTNFSKYSNREPELPFDQHELLALVAPRHLYVASASEDSWADPKGEYLSLYHASPVFELYGMTGLSSPEMPGIQQPIMTDVGHHIRKGSHNILAYDWGNYMDFCDKVFGRTEQHSYKDGICEICGNPDLNYKQLNNDGFYELSNEADLNWFAVMVREIDPSINAVLTADIDDYTGTMIGTSEIYYAGTFDGQCHTIYFTTEPTEPRWSLFRTLSGTVKNLHVAGTITTSFQQVGGLAGFVYGGTIENCVSSVSIFTSYKGDAGTGGILATCMEPGTVVRNCVFDGIIEGENAHSCAGIAGWIASAGRLSLVNCLAIGELNVKTNNGNVIVRNPNNATRENCYYLKPYSTIPSDVTQVTEEQLRSGELCYLLNGDQSNILWTQEIGTDLSPAPFPTGKKVYAVPSGGFLCDGTPQGETGYTNEDPSLVKPSHTYVKGVCSVCGNADPDYKPLNAEGFYELSSEDDLAWFATRVNKGENTLNAMLTDDLNDYSGPMIGTTSVIYGGTFDGQYHNIYYVTEAEEPIWGLFRSLSGTVRNLNLAGSIYSDFNECGGIVGDLFGGTIENCVCNVDIISSFNGDSAYGGLVSRNRQDGAVIRDCVFAGRIEGDEAHSCAGILGWAAYTATLTNCLVIGEIAANANGGDMFARNASKVTRENCYYLKPYGATPSDTKQVTEAQLRSGEAGYLLNGKTYANATWFQLLGVDEYPTPVPERGIIYNINEIYGNAFDDGTLQAFKDAIDEAEVQFIQNVIAQVSLVDAYEAAVEEILAAATVEEMIAAWGKAEPIYASVKESEQAYVAFKAKVEEVKADLEKNENLQNVRRDELEFYLKEFAEPSNLYPNGTAPYILSERLADVETLQAEIVKIDAMYNAALVYEPASGTDITKLLTNPDFSDGWNGWSGKKGTGYDASGTSATHAVECWNNTMDMYQTLTGLQNGIYELQVNGAFRPYPGADDLRNTNYAATLYANDVQNYFQTVIEDMMPADDAIDGFNCHITGDVPDFEVTDIENNVEGYVVHGLLGCGIAFKAGRYPNSVLCNVTDGTLTVGIRQPGTGQQPEWLGFGNIVLIYHGAMEEAAEGLDRTLASMAARATTLVEVYESSSSSDYASYPNFSQALKDELSNAIEAVETTADAAAKYALVEKFSELFRQVYECKKAYIGLMRQTETLNDMAGTLGTFLSADQKTELNGLIERLVVMYEDGGASMEDALKDYAAELSFALRESDGVCQIGTALDFAMFAVRVNNGENALDAVLTADLDDYTGPVVATSTLYYAGTFDGQYHTISFTTEPTEPRWSLFRTLSGTVKNLHVTGNINTSFQQVGGIVGFVYGGTIENCVSSVIINTSYNGDAGTGGILATCMEPGTVVRNCVFNGAIHGENAHSCAGIAGWVTSAGRLSLVNCLAIGEMDVKTNNGNVIVRNPNNATRDNCYYLNRFSSIPADVTQITEDQLRNGEVCYLLNGDQSHIQWTQTIGEDDIPIPFPTGSVVIKNADGTFGNASGIESPRGTTAGAQGGDAIYDLSGRRVERATKGVYIINGRVVLK